MKYKRYDREYEKVFTNEKVIKKRCKLEEISSFNNVPKDNTEYIGLLRETIGGMQKEVFDYMVKYMWLVRRFCYKGKRRKNLSANGIHMDGAFGVFMRNFVGFEGRLMLNTFGSGGKIAGYLDDFFPNFDEGNPFEEHYEYPYKNITLEHLILVYQMPERLDLLNDAENAKMSYTKFLDFVLNYISCYNEEHGEEYIFIFSSAFMPYIKFTKNYEATKTSSVRSRKKRVL